MGINEVDMISDNWLCFILMGHLFMHFLCEFDLIKLEKKTLSRAEGNKGIFKYFTICKRPST